MGGERFGVAVNADTFTNSPAVANSVIVPAGAQLPFALHAFKVNNGDFSGSGTAVGVIQWIAGAGEQLKFPDTVYMEADVVPEPSALAVLAMGTLGLLSVCWRRSVAR